MLLIYRGLTRVEAALERLAAVQAPIIAAAYGMEVNVNGAGLYVLMYLAARQPQYRILRRIFRPAGWVRCILGRPRRGVCRRPW